MSKLFPVIGILALLTSCQLATKNKSESQYLTGSPEFGVDSKIHNFGELKAGEVVYFSFKYTNTGTGHLKIDSVNAGCGCIEINYPDEALVPDDTAYLQVIFNSAGEWGNIYKPIIIYTNTEKLKNELYIGAKVQNQLFNNQ